MREAKLETAGAGVAPAGPGWFVLNARHAQWKAGHFGAFTRFEGQGAEFPSLGINIGVLEPGQPSCFYHGENEQEDFLVLSGECVLIIEGQERHLRAWDFVHCPAWTEHVFVGAGDGPCALLAVGSRVNDEVIYPASELAQSYGAGVPSETRDAEQAYAGIVDDTDASFRDEWLPSPAPGGRGSTT
ncbi:MAG: cupin domain-containing protein [Solirubrobacteraceae bacterium]